MTEESIIQLFNTQNNTHSHIGIGDDCAVIKIDDCNSITISTDTLNENTHFILKDCSASDLASKLVRSNISDILSMYSEPQFCFLNLSLPPYINDQWLLNFKESFVNEIKIFRCHLMGGDTSKSERLSLNLTVIGKAKSENIKLRSNAKLNDTLYVSGKLGDARAYWYHSVNKLDLLEFTNIFKNRHFKVDLPDLSNFPDAASINAMMDISDGLYSDIQKFCKASGLGADIYLDDLPISEELRILLNDDAKSFACLGGEDFQLLFSSSADNLDLKFPIYKIGKVTNQSVRFLNNKLTEVKISPNDAYQHFNED